MIFRLSVPTVTLGFLGLVACAPEESPTTPALSSNKGFDVSPGTVKAGERVRLSAPEGDTWDSPTFAMSAAEEGEWDPKWLLYGGPGVGPAWQSIDSGLPVPVKPNLASVEVMIPDKAAPGVYQLCGNGETACATVTVVG